MPQALSAGKTFLTLSCWSCDVLAFCRHFAYKERRVSTGKSEAVSVRVEPHIKLALQTAAEREMRSLANMVEVMVIAYCRANGVPLEGVSNETLAVVKSKKLS